MNKLKSAVQKCTMVSLLLLWGCSTWVERSNYHLDHYGELVVSDSPTQILQPKRIKTGAIEIRQSLLIQNTSLKSSYTVHTEQARFLVNSQALSPHCVDLKEQPGPLVILANMKNKIDCTLVIEANADNHLLNKDSVGELEIPVDGLDQKMLFNYSLKLEDFEK